jgi:hypothetical protein
MVPYPSTPLHSHAVTFGIAARAEYNYKTGIGVSLINGGGAATRKKLRSSFPEKVTRSTPIGAGQPFWCAYIIYTKARGEPLHVFLYIIHSSCLEDLRHGHLALRGLRIELESSSVHLDVKFLFQPDQAAPLGYTAEGSYEI